MFGCSIDLSILEESSSLARYVIIFSWKENHLIQSKDGGEISPSQRLEGFQTRGVNTPHLKRLASCRFAINNPTMFVD